MTEQHDTFSKYVATLGRGPGRSRALTREEAREAFRMVLLREADPHQIGAFLMLLRFRGEDPDEITGMVEAARDTIGPIPTGSRVDLDWPSYGAGRTRGAPWFLLSALALARAGTTVLMHGTNEYSSGLSVEAGLRALDIAASARFTYLPLASLSPEMDALLRMRRLFGLRSPVNTVARLLNPGDAPASVDGVFHPPYLAVHLGVAERLARQRLFVLKGGGGEAERVPLKAASGWLWDKARGRSEVALPAREGLSPLTPRPIRQRYSPRSGAVRRSRQPPLPRSYRPLGSRRLLSVGLRPPRRRKSRRRGSGERGITRARSCKVGTT
jgi:anthranilate phosphoribosyltransferase